VSGFPAHSLPIDKGTFTDLWCVSFVSFFHMFLPLFNFFNLALARLSMNDNYPPTTLQSFFQWLTSALMKEPCFALFRIEQSQWN
jgi:hypothetical protein